MIYLQTAEKFPIQIQLRSIILLSSSFSDAVMDFYDASGAPPDKAVKMACTVIATVPILCIYPFVQKYFTKGVMVGAVKDKKKFCVPCRAVHLLSVEENFVTRRKAVKSYYII